MPASRISRLRPPNRSSRVWQRHYDRAIGTHIMNIAVASADPDSALVKLPGILDLAAAAGLQEATLHALSASGRVRFDASQVEVVLVPCLQLILAAMRSANVAVEQPSSAFESAFAELGLD